MENFSAVDEGQRYQKLNLEDSEATMCTSLPSGDNCWQNIATTPAGKFPS
jgi:hypothetical protein